MMTSKGAWAWDLFPNMPAAGCCPRPSVQRATCAQTLRKECREWPKAGTLRAKPLLFGLNHSNVSSPVVAERLPELMQNLAAFQLVRGEYAYIGYGFLACDESFNYTLPPELHSADYGDPLGACKEVYPGVFERNFTNSVARLDCNTWVGTVEHAIPERRSQRG